ncbi:DinB family protein [Rubrivirga sp. IMCC43871]|uniref:DinB family protein n=1 Tax=Rubrivirga sp. IMCC43871 TaxID=3391575 RepID=UPI00398FD6B0
MTDLKAPYLDARARLRTLLDGLDDEAFNAKPARDSWSAGECLVHLNKIAKGYLPVMEEAVARGGPTGAPPFRYGFVSRKFIGALQPGTRPLPTGGPMKPPATEGLRSNIDRARVVSRFEADIDRYLAVIDAAEGLDLARIKIRSPFMTLLRLPLGAFLEAMGVHSVRHIAQAERAVAERTV